MSASQVSSAIADGRVPTDISEDYLNEDRDGATILSISVIFAFTTIALVTRVVARKALLDRFGLDDALAILAWALLAAFVGLSYRLILIGSGRHYDYVQHVMTPAVVNQSEVLDYVAHILYTTSLLVCRLSGLALYTTLVKQHVTYVLVVRVVAGFIVLCYIPQLFLIVFHCIPVTGLWPYSWQDESSQYKCLQWGIVYSLNSAVSLCNDILLYGIPIVLIVRLHLSRKRKIQLACILCPGILVIAISIARLVLVIQGQWLADQSWEYDPLLAIEVSEISFTMVSLSLPGCKLLWDRYISSSPRKLLYSSQNSNTKYASNASKEHHSRRIFSDESKHGSVIRNRRDSYELSRGSSEIELRMIDRARSDEVAQMSFKDHIKVVTEVSVEKMEGSNFKRDITSLGRR